MSAKPTPITPSALSVVEAMASSQPLLRLRDALRDSEARFQVVRPALPRALLPCVKPGPVDADGWSLLATNASVAAKLRQLRPLLEELLREAGWAVATVRIKVV